MMTCSQCGRNLTGNVQFCPYCGAVHQYPQTVQPEPMQYAQTAQPEPMQYAPTAAPQVKQPRQKKKKPVLILIILLCVLIAAGGVFGVLLGMKSCKKTTYDKSTPQKAAQSLARALNDNNSREAYKCLSPSLVKLYIYFGLPAGYKGLLFNDKGDPEPEVYDAANSALKLAHKKYDCKISYKNVTEEKESDSKSNLTGDLYFGNINVGELGLVYIQENKGWYVLQMDTSKLDQEKLRGIFEKYGSFTN